MHGLEPNDSYPPLGLSFSLGFRAIEEMRRRLDGFQSSPLTTQDAARILRKPLWPVTPSSLGQADS